MWATLVSKVGRSCELTAPVSCRAVAVDSSAVTGLAFLAGAAGEVRTAIPRQLSAYYSKRQARTARPSAESDGPRRGASTVHVSRLDVHNRKMKSILQFVERSAAPPLLPILRSQQQGEILALLLGNPDGEFSLTDIAARTGAPHPSVFREVERAQQAGLVTSRKVGNTRLVRANPVSPYYQGLADVLVKAFGAPAVLGEVLRSVAGIERAYIFGSWAARRVGQPGQRDVADIDLLVLGTPDRDRLYEVLEAAEKRLGRPVQATIRDTEWLETGSGSFHETVTSRPLLELNLGHV